MMLRKTFSFLAVAICGTACLLAPSIGLSQELGQSRQSSNDQAKAESSENGTSSDQAVATFAAGCFWCTEAVYERMKGVNNVVSGYIGGDEVRFPNPTYQQVLTKITGYAEACEIYYDPKQVSYEELLEVFFKIHDPTSLNRQGNDVGPQYRSAIFYHNDEQKKQAEKYIAKLNASGEFDRPIVTKLEKAGTFYVAEDYHQDYYRKHPSAGYCRAVVRYKVLKFQREFSDKVKKQRR